MKATTPTPGKRTRHIEFEIDANLLPNDQAVLIVLNGKVVAHIAPADDDPASICVHSPNFDGTRADPFSKSVTFDHGGNGMPPHIMIKFAERE